jgi:uncharacterized repeat protein (TIGR01451 family)
VVNARAVPGRTQLIAVALLVLQITLGSAGHAEAGIVVTGPTGALHLFATADLSIVKTDSPDPVPNDSHLTYFIQVTNAGPDVASAVELTDVLPVASTLSTTFLSLTQTSGPAFTCTTPPPRGMGTVTCTAASFAPGSASFVLVMHVDADVGSTLTNVATISSATADLNPANNSDTETTQVSAPVTDLSATKTDAPDPVTAGDNLTYTLTISNNGPSDGKNVVVSDEVPSNTTFVSFSQTDGAPFDLSSPPAGSTGTVTATIAVFPTGTTATFTLVVNVDSTTPNDTVITNTVTVSNTTEDTDLANNTDTETTQVLAPFET